MYVSNISEAEYGSFYSNYIKQVGEEDLISQLRSSSQEVFSFLKTIPKHKLDYRYQADKWTIKDILQHLIDSERVFAYRALRFARQDKTNIPGFEENYYVSQAHANHRDWNELLKEYQTVRETTLILFKSMRENMLLQIGEADGSKMSVRAIGFVIIGHEKHHCKVIQSRYL